MFDGKFPWNLWNTGENIFWKQAMHTSSHDLKKAKRQTSHRIEWSNSSNQRPVWLWSITMLPQVPSLVHEGVKWCENSRKQSFHLTPVDMSSDSLKAASICRLDSYAALVGVNFRLKWKEWASSRMRFGGWLPTLMGNTQWWVHLHWSSIWIWKSLSKTCVMPRRRQLSIFLA